MDCSLSSIILTWRKWIRFVVFVTYVIVLGIALPLCIWELQREGAPDHVTAWFVGGCFVMMALPISLWGILQHVINYTTPHLQRHIIRILWMVPIYALNAWFALRFPSAAIYLDTLRECYEAYVIYNFMAYLMFFLNHEYPHLGIQVENKPPVKHIFPLCCLPPCQNSEKFIQRCKHGVLQYTIVRPAMTVIALICETNNKYDEGDFNFKSAWSYIVIINNMSQILAMYCLVLFYKAFKEELQPIKPLPKFLCVKAVVFLSFWQALMIAALAKLGAIPEHGTWGFYKNIKEVSTGIQDFLICIEMLVAAIAHYFSFSHKPFVNLAAEQQNFFTAFVSMWDVRDVTTDVMEHARYIGRGMHKTLSRGRRLDNGDSNERSPLLVNGDEPGSGGSMERQTSVQNYQNKAPPSPPVVLGAEMSLDGESLASGHYNNENKSITSSMNNYVDFEASGDSRAGKRLSSSASVKTLESADGRDVNSKSSVVNVHSPDQDRVSVKTIMSEQSRHAADDVFEHLDKEEDEGPSSDMESQNKGEKSGEECIQSGSQPERNDEKDSSVPASVEEEVKTGGSQDDNPVV